MVSRRHPIHIPWHQPSEQPYVVPDKQTKRLLQHAAVGDVIKALVTSLWFSPIIAARYIAMRCGHVPRTWKRPVNESKEFLGLAVALHSCPWQQLSQEIQQLGVKHILLRIPVWEMDKLAEYQAFVESLPNCEFVICIMQDRKHIINHQAWQNALHTIVGAFWPKVQTYQIGQGSNRTKWAFFSMGEYLAMAERATSLRSVFPMIRIIGPGVLDFELIPAMRGMIHQFNIKWDVVASALYVDRRGSPRNKQMGHFDLRAKIQALAAIQSCASKSKRCLWITETNWPLKGQGEYSPTSERECVSESDYDTFMQHYLTDAWQTQLVERVYWWQLVSKGYGLIDVNDDGTLRHRPAYHSFKRMLDAKMLALE